MNVFVDAWNARRPARQILADKNREKSSSGVDGQSYVGGLNIERDTIGGYHEINPSHYIAIHYDGVPLRVRRHVEGTKRPRTWQHRGCHRRL